MDQDITAMQQFQSFYIYLINLFIQYMLDTEDEHCLVIICDVLYERSADYRSEDNVLEKLRISVSKWVSNHF